MVFFQCLRLRTYRQLWLVLCLGNSHHHHHHHHHVLKEKVQSAVSTLYYLLAIMPDAFFRLPSCVFLPCCSHSRNPALRHLAVSHVDFFHPLPSLMLLKGNIKFTAALLLCFFVAPVSYVIQETFTTEITGAVANVSRIETFLANLKSRTRGV